MKQFMQFGRHVAAFFLVDVKVIILNIWFLPRKIRNNPVS